MNILDNFISHLEEQVKNHSIYVWGAQGQQGAQITEAWIRRRENSDKNAARAIAFWKKQVAAGYGAVLRAFDCSGLGMYWLQNVTGLSPNDRNANSMMGICKRITKAECRRGDWAFHLDEEGRATHIGYIVDDDLNVIECKGRDDGVVKRPLKKGGWEAFGRPKFFEAYIGAAEQETPAAEEVKQEAAETYSQGRSNEETIYNFLRNVLALNAAGACGVLANVERESGFNPQALGDGGTSYGICQWHASRFERLKAWCAENGKDYQTIDGQLWYLKYELSKSYSAVLKFIEAVEDSAEGAYNAGHRWCLKFEIPANKEQNSDIRGQLARDKYWPKYNGSAAAQPEGVWSVGRLLKLKSPYMRGDDVRRLQEELIAAGFDCGKCGADGVFGKDTDAAVKAYQAAKALEVDGIAGRHTITALGGVYEG